MAKKQTSSGPLSGRSIVVARAEAQAVTLIEAVEAEGADVEPRDHVGERRRRRSGNPDAAVALGR